MRRSTPTKPLRRRAGIKHADAGDDFLVPADDYSFAAPILSTRYPIIYMHEPVTPEYARRFVEAIEELECDRHEPMAIIDINSPGGDLDALSVILSAMESSSMEIGTYVSGDATSAAAVILSAGARGKRFASKFSTIMLHPMLVGAPLEPIEDIQRRIELASRQNEAMLTYVAKNCRKSLTALLKILHADGARDLYLTPSEALNLGMVDAVGTPKVVPATTLEIVNQVPKPRRKSPA